MKFSNLTVTPHLFINPSIRWHIDEQMIYGRRARQIIHLSKLSSICSSEKKSGRKKELYEKRNYGYL